MAFQNQSTKPKRGMSQGWLQTAAATQPSRCGAELCVRIGLGSGLSEHRLQAFREQKARR